MTWLVAYWYTIMLMVNKHRHNGWLCVCATASMFSLSSLQRKWKTAAHKPKGKNEPIKKYMCRKNACVTLAMPSSSHQSEKICDMSELFSGHAFSINMGLWIRQWLTDKSIMNVWIHDPSRHWNRIGPGSRASRFSLECFLGLFEVPIFFVCHMTCDWEYPESLIYLQAVFFSTAGRIWLAWCMPRIKYAQEREREGER